jgi:DNA-binding GntR family transcriptional regulator
VYIALQRAIADGKLQPRLRLRETALAAVFGVSTTPVREALRRLEREGLVLISPNRGATVAAFDLVAARNLYDVRELLECAAVRKAVLLRSHGDDRAGFVLESMRASVADDDEAAFNALDVQFHRALSDLSGNTVLADAAERVHRQIQSVRAHAGVRLEGRLAVSNREHAAILSAFRRGEAAKAERLVRAHIQKVRDEVLAALSDRSRREGTTAHSKRFASSDQRLNASSVRALP